MKKSCNTPNGHKHITKKQYCSEWSELGEKLKSKLGKDICMTGFDPMISFCLAENGQMINNSSVQIPVWLAKRIIGE
jgi:hypothetical protein